MKLRPYQVEPARAILRSAANGDGLTITVMMARQAGKNELSAWIETALLTRHIATGGTGVKAAPTKTPQARISVDRLCAHLDAAGYDKAYRHDDPHIRLGRARWTFYSAAPDANVVGTTASLLLEGDEAQDIAPDKWDKDFRPMAATTNATSVLYGTAWSDDTLLARQIAANLEAEKRDGIRRHFQVPWTEVAERNRTYGRYVEGERARLGANHPLFLTQYELITLPGQGRLLSPAQLAGLHGQHPRQEVPLPGETYVAGLDVAGEDTTSVLRGRDSTVLTIGRVIHPAPGLPPTIHVVAAYETTGTAHAELYAQLATLLAQTWRVRRVAVDATTLGEAAALYLAAQLGQDKVLAIRFTEHSKSELGFGLQAAATTGRLRLWQPDGTREHQTLIAQLRACRATYKPNRTLAWSVPETEGHDDYAVSVALCLRAAEGLTPGRARGRIRTK